MKTIIKMEELGMFVSSIFIFSLLDFHWWWFLVLLLAPDLSIAGYLFGNKTGAITYNFFHHKAVAIVILITGYYLQNQIMLLSGTIMLGHSSMDRLFGYGLKYFEGFHSTHLGIIGKKST